MPWTESRSREEWLAEVQRRGTRIRRRRRIGMGVVGAFALVLPMSAVATTVMNGTPAREMEVSAAGPSPTATVPTTSPIVGSISGGGGMAVVSPLEESPPVGAPSTTTTTEVHQRVATGNGSSVEPTAPRSVSPADDPVVAALAPLGNASIAGAGGADIQPTPSTTLPPRPRPTTCTAADARVTLAMDQASYAGGQAVTGFATLAKTSQSDCWLELVSDGSVYTRIYFRVEDATGRSEWFEGTEISQCCLEPADGARLLADFEPQTSMTFRFVLETSNCPDSRQCVLRSAGTYSIVAEFMSRSSFDTASPGSGRYMGRHSFQWQIDP